MHAAALATLVAALLPLLLLLTQPAQAICGQRVPFPINQCAKCKPGHDEYGRAMAQRAHILGQANICYMCGNSRVCGSAAWFRTECPAQKGTNDPIRVNGKWCRGSC
jgi:hypothetical protein